MNRIGAKVHDRGYRNGLTYSRFLSKQLAMVKAIDRKDKQGVPFRAMDHQTKVNSIGRVFTF